MEEVSQNHMRLAILICMKADANSYTTTEILLSDQKRLIVFYFCANDKCCSNVCKLWQALVQQFPGGPLEHSVGETFHLMHKVNWGLLKADPCKSDIIALPSFEHCISTKKKPCWLEHKKNSNDDNRCEKLLDNQRPE